MAKKKKQEKSKFKFRSTQRFQKPDARYNNMVVTKFVNVLMWGGKKTTASNIFYGAMDLLAKKIPDNDPLDTFLKAIQNVAPQVEVRSRRVGGATYQVPMEVSRRRAQSLAIRQILATCRGRGGKPMAERLADELMAAFRREGASITWRENTHKMAEANKLFAHYAW
ncbi:MAG TPA: 30S ribosomal protein S7 [Planctomycetes bacterium]|nr:30S ribosomal protein S7 [Planctomycetota bacterium]HIN79804.1 30S ribosomal protein S7 [Planctomycetota bacterium]